MFIITRRVDNVYIDSAQAMNLNSNDYFLLVEKDIVYSNDDVYCWEIDSIPAEVEYQQWCYTPEEDFYPNPNWTDYSELTAEEILSVLEEEAEINE